MFASVTKAIFRKDKKSKRTKDNKETDNVNIAAESWWNNYSCVNGNKSPRNSRSFTRSNTLPYFQRKPSPGERKYESYVQAQVAANAKSPVEDILIKSPPPPPPPAPPRRHMKLLSSNSSVITDYGSVKSPSLSDKLATSSGIGGTLQSPVSSCTDGGTAADAQTLYNIRQQMALSLKRMKDLEEQVKTIPELQHELKQLREEKESLQQILQRKQEELQRTREMTRSSGSQSPIASPKNASPVLFTPQRISPVSLESLGARLRTSSTSSMSEKTKALLKRDVGTSCGLPTTRDIAVGSPVIILRSTGTNPAMSRGITEMFYTQIEMEERVQIAISAYEERQNIQRLKNKISVGTQMYVSKQDKRDTGIQTSPEKTIIKYSVGVDAIPQMRDNFMNCKPDVRSIAVSEDRINDLLCEKCTAAKRSVACGTEDNAPATKANATVSLKLLDMQGRSNTFSLGDNEKLNLIRKATGTQCDPTIVHNAGSQTAITTHTIGIQYAPVTQNVSTQSCIDQTSRQTDTKDLIRLIATQTSTEEISPPAPPKRDLLLPVKPKTCNTGINTDLLKTVENGVNPQPPVAIRHTSSNTDEVHKRDIACGDTIKPHISIACADNYCDSCKDAIKNLAKDFSKVSVHPARAVESKIPRPKHLTSPSPVRKLFQRQNTYTVTPSPSTSPSPTKLMSSSLHEKSPAISGFDSLESSCGETQSFITVTKQNQKPIVSENRSLTTSQNSNHELEGIFDQAEKLTLTPRAKLVLSQIGDDDLIVREEKRVSISWSRDASPVPLSKSQEGAEILASGSPKSLESSINEKMEKSTDLDKSELPATVIDENISKGARKKNSPLKSSQQDNIQVMQITEDNEEKVYDQKPPSKALLQKLAMVETKPREKIKPKKELLSALKIINESLLKKLGAKSFSSVSLKSGKTLIQQEWFRVSSTEKANPHEVEDYLDCFEEFSVPLLEYCVNLTDSNGNTAMHYAVSHGNFDVVSILLDSKVCNVNQMNNAGYTCVMLVSLAKLKNVAHRTVVERLFQMADVNIRAKKHCQTALMLAVSHGNLDMVEMLLAAGADINIQDEDGSTALMCAAEHGRIDIVKHLLSQSECDSLKQDMDGSTAFKIAWQAGHRDIGLLLYVHEQMLRAKMSNREPVRTPISPQQHKRQPSQ